MSVGVGLGTRKSFPPWYTSNVPWQVCAKGCQDIFSRIKKTSRSGRCAFKFLFSFFQFAAQKLHQLLVSWSAQLNMIRGHLPEWINITPLFNQCSALQTSFMIREYIYTFGHIKSIYISWNMFRDLLCNFLWPEMPNLPALKLAHLQRSWLNQSFGLEKLLQQYQRCCRGRTKPKCRIFFHFLSHSKN